MRNRFKKGDVLEVLSPGRYHNAKITVDKMFDESGKEISDAMNVQQKVRIVSDVKLSAGDILRKKNAIAPSEK